MYSMYSTNQMYIEQNLHILILQKEILFLCTYKCVDGRYILQQAKTLSYCLSLAINVKKKVTILEALTENQTSKSINSFL